jgi:hypothetical protein
MATGASANGHPIGHSYASDFDKSMEFMGSVDQKLLKSRNREPLLRQFVSWKQWPVYCEGQSIGVASTNILWDKKPTGEGTCDGRGGVSLPKPYCP